MVLVYTDGSTKYSQSAVDDNFFKQYPVNSNSITLKTGDVVLVTVDMRGNSSYSAMYLLQAFATGVNIHTIFDERGFTVSKSGKTVTFSYSSYTPSLCAYRFNTTYY